MDRMKLTRKHYDKKFKALKDVIFQIPPMGWIRTIRENLGMNNSQLAAKMGVKQPRINVLENNEENLKISTLKKAAAAMGCEFFYAFIPKISLDAIIKEKAKEKAIKKFKKLNHNMALENQAINLNEELLEELIQEILAQPLSRIWDDESE